MPQRPKDQEGCHAGDQRARRQRVLADFGDLALRSEDLDAVLTEACRLVGEAMGEGRAKELEIEPGGGSLFVRAGVGWAPGMVGHVRLPMEEHSSETYAISLGEPVITQDLAREERFDVPAFMKAAGVAALVNVPILLPGTRAYGLIEVDDTEPRDFDQGDIESLRTYASILGPVIDRLLAMRALRNTQERQVFLLTLADALRPLAAPADIQQAAPHLLGDGLGVSRTMYAEVHGEGDAA